MKKLLWLDLYIATVYGLYAGNRTGLKPNDQLALSPSARVFKTEVDLQELQQKTAALAAVESTFKKTQSVSNKKHLPDGLQAASIGAAALGLLIGAIAYTRSKDCTIL